MADKGIRNVTIKKEQLGKVTSSNARVVRFRIVSEDKNRKSAYSKIFIIGSEVVIVGPGDVNVVGNTVLVNWSDDRSIYSSGVTILSQIIYDVFAGFDGSTPSYLGSTGSQNYSFLKNGTQSVRVVIQISSIKPALADYLEIYDSGLVSLV